MRLVIMKGLFILIVSFILFGCSKNYLFRRDNIAISEEMKRIIEEDQNVRNQIAPIHKKYKLRTFNTVIDSIADLGLDHIPDGVSFDFKPIGEQVKSLSPENREKCLAEIEEQYKKMHHIDSVNFEKTYRIIKKYGFPEYDLREWKHDSLRAGITTVATHFNYSSNKGKKMQKLIIKEYKKGRIGDVGMRQMLWHIKGRKGNAIGDLQGKSINDVILELEESLK